MISRSGRIALKPLDESFFDKVINVQNVLGPKIKVIVPNAMELAHYKDLYRGTYWFHVPTSTLRYERDATGHHDLRFFGDMPVCGQGWVRGRVFTDEKDKVYIMVYSEDFHKGRIPGLILKGIYDKLVVNFNEPIWGMVDDVGHDLIGCEEKHSK